MSDDKKCNIKSKENIDSYFFYFLIFLISITARIIVKNVYQGDSKNPRRLESTSKLG